MKSAGDYPNQEDSSAVLHLAKIVGTSTDNNWSQIHAFLPDDLEKKSRRGQLLAAISLAGLGEGMDPVVVGREIISRLHEEYYGDLGGSPFEKLRLAVSKAAAEVSPEIEIEIAAAAFREETLYLAIIGQGEVIFQRDGRTATILSGSGNASGYLKDGDIFFLGTGQILKILEKNILHEALVKESPAEAKDLLMPIIQTQLSTGALAGLIARVEKKENKLKEKMEIPLREKKEKFPFKTRWGSLVRLAVVLAKSRVSPSLLRWKRRLKQKLLASTSERRMRSKRSQKTAVTVALILLLLLGVSVVLGQWQKKRVGQNQQIRVVLEKARVKKEEGDALLDLNPLKARELLLEAQGFLRELGEIESSPRELVDFEKELEVSLARVLHEHQVEPKVFFDLELIKAGASGSDWDFSAEKMVILDKGKSTIYSLGLEDKQSAILAGGENLSASSQIAAFLPRIFTLTKEGIAESNQETRGQKLVIGVDDDWHEIVDLRAFDGNLYFLEKEGKIWKYSVKEGQFGVKEAWLESGPVGSEAISMAIDGSVWVLNSDGGILKYVRGRRDVFGVAGLDKPLLNPAAIYADADQEKIYVLDRGNSRVLVLAKSGEYDSQYLWEGFREATDLVASEKAGKILVLKGSKVYETQLR